MQKNDIITPNGSVPQLLEIIIINVILLFTVQPLFLLLILYMHYGVFCWVLILNSPQRDRLFSLFYTTLLYAIIYYAIFIRRKIPNSSLWLHFTAWSERLQQLINNRTWPTMSINYYHSKRWNEILNLFNVNYYHNTHGHLSRKCWNYRLKALEALPLLFSKINVWDWGLRIKIGYAMSLKPLSRTSGDSFPGGVVSPHNLTEIGRVWFVF